MVQGKIKRIRNTSQIEMTEKKSLFIGFSTIVKNEEEALEIIKQKKKQYSDATHNVYAYVIGDQIARYSDDNEPQGTAGMPVLNAIRMAGIADVLVVVTRYFGGILLGAGGLVRAYSTTASLALEAAGVSIYENYTVLRVCCSYSDYGKLNTELNNFDAIVDSSEFGTDVVVQFAIKEEDCDNFIARITEVFASRIKPTILDSRIDTK